MRIIKISGTAGSGKTRLSMDFARRYSDNVLFTSSELLPSASAKKAHDIGIKNFKCVAQFPDVKKLFEHAQTSMSFLPPPYDCVVVDMVDLLKTNQQQNIDDFIVDIAKQMPVEIKTLIVSYSKHRNIGDGISLIVKEETFNHNAKQKINMNKQYAIRDGRPVNIVGINEGLQYGVVGIIDGFDQYSFWTIYGEQFADKTTENPYDLIEVGNQNTHCGVIAQEVDFKLGDRVLVRDRSGEKWHRRYFSHTKDNGTIYALETMNSWSNAHAQVPWRHCIRWEDRTPDMDIE